MSIVKQKALYEKYHLKSKSQNKIIGEKNFTYIKILSILNAFLTPSTRKILDIGCGSGTISFYLGSKGYRVSGIDISSKAIVSCTESTKRMGLKNVDFKLSNFPNDKIFGKYDFVFLSEVIEHLPNDILALKKIYNLLSSQGTLFLSTPSNNAPLYRWGLTKEFDKRVGHERRYSINELSKKLKDANFNIIKIYKSEGLLRNFLFVNPYAGKFIRYIKGPLVNMFSYADDFVVKIFGESQLIIIAKKATLK